MYNNFDFISPDASHVIGLFPDLLPPEFRNKLEYPGAIPELTGIDLENGLTALIQFLVIVILRLYSDDWLHSYRF